MIVVIIVAVIGMNSGSQSSGRGTSNSSDIEPNGVTFAITATVIQSNT